MRSGFNQSDIADVLRFYAEAGLDFAFEEDLQNRLIAVAPLAKPLEPSGQNSVVRPAMASASSAVPDDAAVHRAEELARAATSLDALRQTLENFEGCGLKFTAKNLVFASDPIGADVLIIGDAPSREDDLAGKPFSGAAGLLLDKMLGAIGLDRAQVNLANVIFWRPPGNRAPTPMETQICRPFIMRQIEILNPKFVVLLGDLTTKCLLAKPESILRMRGIWAQIHLPAGRSIPALPMVHPEYLIKQPMQKKLAWRDLLSLKARLRS